MREFNYKRAWDEWAQPRFAKLTNEIVDLLNKVIILAPILKQDLPRSCNVPFPKQEVVDAFLITLQRGLSSIDFSDFQSKWKEIDPEVLREAATVLYFYGHWMYGKYEKVPTPPRRQAVQDSGAYWKFKYLADNTLIAAGQDPSKVWEDKNWVIDDFMDHKAGTTYDREEIIKFLRSVIDDLWSIHDYDYVNWRVEGPNGKVVTTNNHHRGRDWGAHPPMIGNDFFDDKISQDDKKCAICGHSLRAHKSDGAVILDLKRDMSQSEASASLKRMVEVIAAHNVTNPKDTIKVDGFAFLQRKFTITKDA